MKMFSKKRAVFGFFALLVLIGFTIPGVASAASTPSLGTAGLFGVLSSTFTRNGGLTAITGSVGFTTLSGGGTHSLTGTSYTPAPPQAGLDQNTALAALNGEGCTFTFATGAIDLAADITHSSSTGVYTPGVYCVDGAMSVGTAGIELSGSGTYIFRSTGALDSVDNSIVSTSSGASVCDVFWTPVATTLGANTTFLGTVIDNAGITVGNMTSWIGRALNFATTITTDTDTITVPSCGATAADLHVIKSVDNTGGGTATTSDFNVYVKLSGTNVAGSPALGTSTPGTAYILSPGTYTVSEDATTTYTQSFSAECTSGSVTLADGDNKTCTVTNTYIIPTVAAPASSGRGSSGGRTTYGCKDPKASNYNAFSASDPKLCIYTSGSGSSIATTAIAIATTSVPKLPNSGFPYGNDNTFWYVIIAISVIAISSVAYRVKSKK